MMIRPGDLMIGDADGLLCVPIEEAEALLAAGTLRHQAEERILAEVRAGTRDMAWIDAALQRLGCALP
jgi:regulator of RNase E activity RraA